MKVFKKKEHPGYKTRRQWAKLGMLPKVNAAGIELWSNQYCQLQCTYFGPNDVETASAEQIAEFFKPERERQKKKRQQKRAEQIAAIEREHRKEQQKLINNAIRPYLKRLSEINGTGKTIIIDTETTGLDPEKDELLQASIIDVNGNVLFNSYFKPSVASWVEAEKINCITPEMVKTAPSIADKMPEINEIMYAADKIIGYNTGFDLRFLENSGLIIADDAEVVDVMREFAPIFGEWSESKGDYKWQKLTTCAEYYGYSFTAHDSLEDTRATLFCYKKIIGMD